MDWLQFFASIAGSLAWPGAVVLLVLMLREPLGKVVPFIRTLKYKEFQIDVAQELEAARKTVKGNGDEAIAVPETPTPVSQKIAQVDPRAAVLSAWAPVELAIYDLAMCTHTYEGGRPLHTMLKRMHTQGTFDDETYQVLERLRRIRNEAIHQSEISFDEAISMSEMCEWALQKLKTLDAATHVRTPVQGSTL